MISDRYVQCRICRRTFVFSVEEQLRALREVPLDDLLDPPGKEQWRWVVPPTECGGCVDRLAKRK